MSSSGAPAATGSSPEDYGSFKLLQSVDLDYAPVSVSKWRSNRTGLTVTLGQHSTPITNGYFVIASEIFDDTGRPHTLEHLVFLGSKAYPYKGVLDSLANRAGSNGTNAWTANDHTAYTISTAGSKGFLEMLPVYVDHILHPTLTDAGFVTEVHHVAGSAEDAGVVYSEMQGRENQAGDRMALELQRMLYPESSAYRSETGGLLKMLRILTVEQIREYHAKYYVPYNLCLHIDGAVDLNELFSVLNDKVEPMILAAQKPAPVTWKRPFVESTTSQPLSIPASQTRVVEFMEEDDSMGEVFSVFLGPAPTDYTTNTALHILGSYLTHSAASPLYKEFVEIPKPFATSIGFAAEDRVNANELGLWAVDVPKKHLMDFHELVRAKLKNIVEKEGIDMDRMRMVLRRNKRQMLNAMETDVTGVLVDVVVGDFLYGEKDGKELPSAFDDLKDYATLEKWTAEQWLALLDKYYVSPNTLTVIGKPSPALSAKIEADEKARIAAQKEAYGEKGLEELERKLEHAKKESDQPIPPEMLTSFPLADPDTITWVPVQSALNPTHGDNTAVPPSAVQAHVDADPAVVPFQAHFAHAKSNFVRVHVLVDTAGMPAELKPYVSVLSDSIFTIGVKQPDGTELSHEEVANQLNDFTVAQSAGFGFSGNFYDTLVVALKVERDNYERAVQWIRDLLTGAVFSVERLKVIFAKALQALPHQKRSGDRVARLMANRLVYDQTKSTSESCALLGMLDFVPRTVEALESVPEAVVAKLEEMRKHLLDPSKIRVNVSGDILSLPEPKATLARSFISFKEAAPLAPLTRGKDMLTELGKNPSKQLTLVPMAAIEGSYSVHYARGPLGWNHEDVPALRLATAVLNAMEAYLWKSIRGAGLAYGADVDYDVESGLVEFSVYRSPNASIAYEEAGKVMRGIVDGTIELDQNIVDGARAGLTYSFAVKSETVMGAASTVYLDEVLRGVGAGYGAALLSKLKDVTLAQLRDVITRYYLPVFDPATAVGAATVNTGKADEVEDGYKKLGFEVRREELPSAGAEDSESGESGSESGSEDSEGSESSEDNASEAEDMSGSGGSGKRKRGDSNA
ncbi:hypothetical protein Q5752_004450 [Cryptotrichosporon argae]